MAPIREFVILVGAVGLLLGCPQTDEGDDDDVTGDDDTGEGDYCDVDDYEPCEGGLVDTWAFRALCPEDPAVAADVCEHPYDNVPECTGTGNEAICDGTVGGTLAFQADGTVDVDVSVTLVTTWHFTDECLETVVDRWDTPEERCADLDTNEGQTCTYTESCVCVTDPQIDSTTTTADYAVEGQDLTIGDDPPSTYCVDGDRLTMDFYAFHPDSWRYWVLERDGLPFR